jgi:hypothetical protein
MHGKWHMSEVSKALGIALLAVVAIYYFQFFPRKDSVIKTEWQSWSSPLLPQANAEYIRQDLLFRTQHPIFSTRRATTAPIIFIQELTNLSLAKVYVGFHLLLIFITALLVYGIAWNHAHNHQWAVFSMLFYFSFYDMLCFYSLTNYTFDEPVQYFFLLVVLLAYQKRWPLCLIAAGICASCCRESSLFVVAALCISECKYYYFQRSRFWTSGFAAISIMACILCLVVVQYYSVYNGSAQSLASMQSLQASRLGLFRQFNYATMAMAIESVVACLMGVAICATLLYFLPQYWKSSTFLRSISFAFGLCWVANTLAVQGFAYAREVRLSVLPALLIVPFCGRLVPALKAGFRTIISTDFSKLGMRFVVVVSTAILLVCALFTYYSTSIGPRGKSFNLEYSIFCILWCAFVYLCRGLSGPARDATSDRCKT